MNDSLPSNELLSQAWDDIDSLMEYAFDNGFHELGYDPARVISDEMERVAQELADLKAAGSSAPEPSAWQPIETAPADEPVLVWWPDWGLKPFIAECYLGKWSSPRILHEQCGEPLAWTPLPAPPSSSVTKGADHA
jgi:hypothetical protein